MPLRYLNERAMSRAHETTDHRRQGRDHDQHAPPIMTQVRRTPPTVLALSHNPAGGRCRRTHVGNRRHQRRCEPQCPQHPTRRWTSTSWSASTAMAMGRRPIGRHRAVRMPCFSNGGGCATASTRGDRMGDASRGKRCAGPAAPWLGTLVACAVTPMPGAVAGRLCIAPLAAGVLHTEA